MDFVATNDFKSPYVISTGMPHKPTQIKVKRFKKGAIIKGEMKHANGKPAFVLWKGVVVVPLSCVKQVITKDVNLNSPETEKVSSAEGEGETDIRAEKPKVPAKSRKEKAKDDTKKQFADGIVVGGAVGFLLTVLAEKKGWIAEPVDKNKFIGAGVGAAIGVYLVFRFRK